MHRQSQLATPLSPRGSNTEALARVPTFSTGEIRVERQHNIMANACSVMPPNFYPILYYLWHWGGFL